MFVILEIHACIAQLWSERNIGNVEVLSSTLSTGFCFPKIYILCIPLKNMAKKKEAKKPKKEEPKKEEKKKPAPKGKPIGEVSNYFQHVKAAAIKLSSPLKVGAKIRIVGGEDTDFEMDVKSMQVERKDIKSAKKGDEIGLLVPKHIRKGYKVYKA